MSIYSAKCNMKNIVLLLKDFINIIYELTSISSDFQYLLLLLLWQNTKVWFAYSAFIIKTLKTA